MTGSVDIRRAYSPAASNRRLITAKAVRKCAEAPACRSAAKVESAVSSLRDVLFVIAAGNQGQDVAQMSASFCRIAAPNIVCVASVDASDRFAGFPKPSNYGRLVGLAALGVDIPTIGSAGSVQRESGTSLAAARVSGIAAQVWASTPELTAAELANALCAGARKTGRLETSVRCGVADLAGSMGRARATQEGRGVPRYRARPERPRERLNRR